MRKFLEKLPTEGLLIIVVVLISLIVIIYLTKIDSVINTHNDIVVTNIVTTESNDALFISDSDVDDKIVLDNPKPVKEESVVEVKRKVRLFFIKVNDDGQIILKSVLKSIYVGKSPLRKSLERLLSGPDTQDINRGLLTLIPEGSEILSINIKNGIAYINFNEMFKFNPLGVEGYIAQIKQIVYTATEYETVHSVQFLIDGAVREYLGPEGVFIGSPISIDNLSL